MIKGQPFPSSTFTPKGIQAMLFKIVKRSYNYASETANPPLSFRTRAVGYASVQILAYNVLIGDRGSEIKCKPNVLVPFVKVKDD